MLIRRSFCSFVSCVNSHESLFVVVNLIEICDDDHVVHRVQDRSYPPSVAVEQNNLKRSRAKLRGDEN